MKKKLSITIDTQLAKAILKGAKKRKIPVSTFINRGLEHYMCLISPEFRETIKKIRIQES